MIEKLVRANRSCRRFDQDYEISGETLKKLVNLARMSASAANRQPLKYILSNGHKINSEIFECLTWAGYLNDWSGPEEGERPSGYIVIAGDTTISNDFFEFDTGIASQSILLGAREIGLAGCMIAAIKRERLRKVLDIAPALKIVLVLALGRPGEICRLEPINDSGSIRYWRDQDEVHHVPKRSLDDIVIKCYGT